MITQTEIARREGVSPQRISKLIKDGKLIVMDDSYTRQRFASGRPRLIQGIAVMQELYWNNVYGAPLVRCCVVEIGQ